MAKKFLFIDAFSSLHVGNGALLDDSYKLVNQYYKPEKITIATSDVESNAGRYKHLIEDVFGTYPSSKIDKLIWAAKYLLNCLVLYCYVLLGIKSKYWMLGARFSILAKEIADADVVVSVSGESINDGFAPQMYMRVILFYICIKAGKDFIVFPQSIGPIYRSISALVLRFTLKKAKYILARDKESYLLSKKIWGAYTRVEYCPDVAIIQDSQPCLSHGAERLSPGKKIIGLTVSDVPNEIKGSEGFLDEVLKAIGESVSPEKFTILLMPSNYKKLEESQDYKLCLYAKKELAKIGFETDILNNSLIHPEEFQGIQKKLDLFISSRMHVGILGTSAGTPTIMINSQHKILGYMENISMGHMVLNYEQIPQRLSVLIKETLENGAAISQQLLLENNKIKQVQHSVFESLLD